MRLLNLIIEQLVDLKPIEEYESDFGTSYLSKFVKTPHKFAEMLSTYNTKVGEIEYGDVDDNTVEIISIHIDKHHRGKGFGRLALGELIKLTKKKTVILKAAPSSVKFWKKLGFTPIAGEASYFTKAV